MPSPNTYAQHAVTAVIVAHDGAAWIPHVTQALLNQTRPVDRVVAVDTGSRDRSGAMLAEALGRGAVFGMDRPTGYGAAVHQALRHRAANAHLPPVPGASAERVEWVWLLHDDCEPETDALEQLLSGAVETPGAAVLGPKVMDWSDRDVLLETGFTIDRVGRRVTGIEPREMDQGQHDGDRDVLAVGSAGMLVRRDVWERVGGFDPAMRLFREDVDFCWRVQAAGHRVRVVTDAVVYHVEASARNRRAASGAWRSRQDRRNALLVLGGNLPFVPMVASMAGNFVLSLLRTVFFLLVKRPAAAADESAAYLSVVGQPLTLISARRRRARGRRAAYSRVRSDIPPGRSFRKLAEYASIALSKSNPSEMVGSHHATEDPSDDDSLLIDSGIVQRLLTNPGVLLFLGLTVITLVAARSLLGSSPLAGGALVPAWGGASDLWQEYLQGFHPVGIGTAVGAPPYVAVLAFLATLLGGKPWLAVDVILIGCVPLAGVTAYLAARRATSFVAARVWAALSYALLPVALGTVGAGHLGVAVVLILLPLLGLLAARTFTLQPRRARRAAWATGLALAVATAFVPLIWLISLVLLALGLVAYRRSRPVSLLNAAIMAVVPLVLLAPWTLDLLTHPAQLVLGTGLQLAGLASSGLPAKWLLLLWPGGPGLPPPWVAAGLVAAAAIALVLSARRGLVLAGWGVALVGLLVAAGVSRIVATPPGASTAVTAWPGAALAVAGAGLVLAAAAAAEPLRNVLSSGRWRSPRGLVALVLGAAAASSPVLVAGSWVVSGVNGPVRPSAGPLLPAPVQVAAETGARPRTLVLREDSQGRIEYSVLRSSDPLIGTPDLAIPPAARHALDLAVAELAAPDGSDAGDQGRALAALGIGFVLVPAPVNASLAHVLDGVPGLQTFSHTASFELWQVTEPSGQAMVIEPNGTLVPVTSSEIGVSGARLPSAGGTLVLAEPAGGWSASVNGSALTPLATPVDGWAQGFRLPPGGGRLTVTRSELPRDVAVGLEGLAVLVVAGLGLPGARTAGEAEAEAAAVAEARRREEIRREASRREARVGGAGGRRAGGLGADDRGEDDQEQTGREELARAGAHGRRTLRRGKGAGKAAPGRRKAGLAGRKPRSSQLADADSQEDRAFREFAGRPGGAPGRDGADRGASDWDDLDGAGPDRGVPRGTGPQRGVPDMTGPQSAVPGGTGPRRAMRGGTGPRRAMPDGAGPRHGAPDPTRPQRGALDRPGAGQRPPQRDASDWDGPQRGAPDWDGPQPGGTGPRRAMPEVADPRRAAADGTGPRSGMPGRAGARRGIPDRTGPQRGMPEREGPRRGGPDRTGPQSAGPGWDDPRRGGPDWTGPHPRAAAPEGPRREARDMDGAGRRRGAPDGTEPRRGMPGGSGRGGRPDWDEAEGIAEPTGRDARSGRGRLGLGQNGRRLLPGRGGADSYGADSGRDEGRGRGRGGRSGGRADGPAVPRGRLPGDDATLPPLPPLPPRAARPRRPGQGYAPDDGPAAWDDDPRHDPGESDW